MKRALISSLLATAVAGVAFAGTQDEAVIALHVKSYELTPTNICPGNWSAKKGFLSTDPNTKGISCADYVTEKQSVDAADTKTHVYLMVANALPGPGIAGMSCGIAYGPNLKANGWTLCADLQFPNGAWPANGGGNRITWAAGARCQNGSAPSDDTAMSAGVSHGRDFTPAAFNVHAIAGAFYMYSYVGYSDVLMVTPNNGLPDPELQVADCNAAQSDVHYPGGQIGYEGELGLNPCLLIVPTEKTTWGAIKSRSE
jgi:hypothetical protein